MRIRVDLIEVPVVSVNDGVFGKLFGTWLNKSGDKAPDTERLEQILERSHGGSKMMQILLDVAVCDEGIAWILSSSPVITAEEFYDTVPRGEWLAWVITQMGGYNFGYDYDREMDMGIVKARVSKDEFVQLVEEYRV